MAIKKGATEGTDLVDCASAARAQKFATPVALGSEDQTRHAKPSPRNSPLIPSRFATASEELLDDLHYQGTRR